MTFRFDQPWFFLGLLIVLPMAWAALRWFVHDKDDERFLRAEVEAVFDAPEPSEQHRAGFLERCTQRAARQAAPST